MKCPYCNCTENWGMIRYPWMGRVVPKMRNRRCSACGREYARWLGCLSLSHDTARRLVFLSVVGSFALGVVGVVFLVVWVIRLQHACVL